MGPLSEEEKEGLIPDYLTDRSTVYQLEQVNIENTLTWLRSKKLTSDVILSVDFIQSLHKRMFGDVWRWAGKYRLTDKNLGVSYPFIPMKTKALVDDARYWHENNVYPPEELAIRFKHRLVSIHCFPNGNGRHSRLMADIIMEKIYGLSYFPWGNSNLVANDEIRKRYIEALKKADAGETHDLIIFAKWSE